MSGDYRTRENRVWDDTIQNNVAPFRFFWEFVTFVNNHTGFTVLAYGTDTTQSGTTIPASWLAWDGVTAPPFSDKDWFVFRADNASTLLNGNGNYQWEAKIQVVNTSGTNFTDCSGINYGLTTEDQFRVIENISLFTRNNPADLF